MNQEYIIQDTRHPHYGCIGTIDEGRRIESTGQYIMDLTSCAHGTQCAGVAWRQLEKITKTKSRGTR